MEFSGCLSKLNTEVGSPIRYFWETPAGRIPFNEFIGHNIHLTFHQQIFCVECGKQTKKSFFEGFCYPCSVKSPQTSPCIIRPECCEAHLGKGKDPEWEERVHNQPHFVYLAASSAIKVGVTRDTQIPTRWIDQGASKAMIFAQTPNRYLAGCIEVALKSYVTDKTSWQAMLKNEQTTDSLIQTKARLTDLLDPEYRSLITSSDEIIELHYPVLEYPTSVKSVSFDKEAELIGRLVGIKGQYLLLGTGQVLNVRKHTGYKITLQV